MAVRELRGGQLRFLTGEGIASLHAAVLEVLEEVGVRMTHRPALEVMESCGCRVDHPRGVVRIPEHVVRRCLSTAPSRFTLHARDPRWDVRVDQASVYTIGGSSALYVLGLDGVRRPATLRDLADLTRLQDSLENLHVMHGIVNPQDIPQEGFDRILFSTVMQNTSRNYYSQALGGQGVRDQVEMASLVAGGSEAFREKPFFTIVVCLVSPLVHPRIRTEELMECARLGVPVYVEGDCLAGATTPVTIAGTLVEQSANILAGICLAQMVRPGLPCIYSLASGILDMSTGSYSGGAPETQLIHAASAQLAHSFGLPCQAGTGIESCLPDAQMGYERGLQVLTCALAGADFVHLSVGMLEQMLTTAYEACLIDDEILGAAFRIVRGFEVNPETIALDLIKRVGIGGEYLGEEHTARHLREVTWFPGLTNRQRWEIWAAEGGKDMRQRGIDKARRVLEEHHPEHLEPKLAAELERMARSLQDREIQGVRSGAVRYD
jgi:trimethylamine---corrinoid protein Co-methyltransferase